MFRRCPTRGRCMETTRNEEAKSKVKKKKKKRGG